MAKLHAQYVAGYFDGEGCVQAYFGSGVQVNCIHARLTIGSTDRDIIFALQKQFGGTIREIPLRKAHHKQAYEWRVSGKEAEILAETVLPYSIAKKKQLELFLMLRSTLRYSGGFSKAEAKRRERLVSQIKKEKLRG